MATPRKVNRLTATKEELLAWKRGYKPSSPVTPSGLIEGPNIMAMPPTTPRRGCSSCQRKRIR